MSKESNTNTPKEIFKEEHDMVFVWQGHRRKVFDPWVFVGFVNEEMNAKSLNKFVSPVIESTLQALREEKSVKSMMDKIEKLEYDNKKLTVENQSLQAKVERLEMQIKLFRMAYASHSRIHGELNKAINELN